MQRVPLLVLSILLFVTSAGCCVFRPIEQWKCDNWGMCHFGIKPTPKCPEACDPYSTPYGTTPYGYESMPPGNPVIIGQ